MSLLPLGAALVVLMIDSAIELSLISSMVGYLHRSGANKYPFDLGDGTSAVINAKPVGLLLNEGHTSNGAAGTALVLICFGGFLVLWHQRRRERKRNANAALGLSRVFLAYTIFTILSFLLTLSALAYTFAVSNQTKGQTIDKTVAAQFQGNAYPKDQWTPGTWTKALLSLPITSDRDAAYLRQWLRVMEGWKWNLIPLFLIGLVVASLSVMHCQQQRRRQTSTATADDK
ncbi:hypothetical protein OIDMADRAFT_53219 [Oidiodendron maius Zn]|uniref:Uncharacterized protein n=1 Tax=Oidiodendron maius (strain Zn) TaxID=913774 RepID=A0A0C3CRS3_OIDMZ|nr:hypothetical protein OIDMADRAFT_53219 [Oidiodendron maius Zn]